MRGMSDKQKSLYTEKCDKINVIVYDMEKLSIDLTKQLNEVDEYKGKNFEVKDKHLARVLGQDIITDNECCFYNDIEKGFKIDVYQKGVEKTDENGKKSTSIFMFPTCTITLTESDLRGYVKEETKLTKFMGDRFIYNQRVVSNIDFMINNFKK